MSILSSPPTNNSVIELDPNTPGRAQPFYMAKEWVDYITLTLVPQLQSAPGVVDTFTFASQNAAINLTALPLPSLSAGLYRVSYYLRVTTADGVSSSATVSIGWTDGGIACEQSGAALTGNQVSSAQSGSFLLNIDPASAISYAVVYASHTAGQMVFKLQVCVESIG